MRRGLRLLLESQPGFMVVAEASDGRQAVEQAETPVPTSWCSISPCRISAELKPRNESCSAAHAAIVILSMHSDEGYVLRALKAGAKGYLLKDSAEGDLIEAIKAVTRERRSSAPRSAGCWWRTTCAKSGARRRGQL